MKFALYILSAITLTFAWEPTINSRIALSSRANGLAPTVDPTTYVPNSGGGGTYPRLAQLVDGSVLATTTTFSGATHILTVTRSTDGARTFSAWGTVSTGTGDLDNLFVKQLANGDVLATFRNHDKNSAGDYTIYRITACISHDNGKTWAFLSQVDTRTATTGNINGLWEPFLRIAKSGAIQVYYAAGNSETDQDILMRSSTNGGTTWSAATTVAGATTTGRDGMPGCTDFTSGGTARVICIFETTEGTYPTFTVKSVVSTNDGVSFGERAQVFVPGGSGNNAGAPQVVTTTGGTLVASFATDEDTSAHTWPSGGSMKILTSLPSDPAVWGQKTIVSPVSSLWAGLFARSDGSNTVVGCADNNGAKCHEVSFA
ncbi:neuraminidase [Mycena alexandri]|uniref:Neuraminidase n=1 Tax=Mycena alexandri TaxID=1745969 RepID=A0AAD6SJA1_9AGAR|nr:neuraminidase [Mycena alexandri]